MTESSNEYPYMQESREFNDISYLVISCTSPKMKQKHEEGISAIKIHSAHRHLNQAQRSANAIATDTLFNVLIIQSRFWQAFPPTEEMVALEVKKRDEIMHDAITKYIKGQISELLISEKRKEKMLEKAEADSQAVKNCQNPEELPKGEPCPEALDAFNPLPEANVHVDIPDNAKPVKLTNDEDSRLAVITIAPLRELEVDPLLEDGVMYRVDAVTDSMEQAKVIAEELRVTKGNKHLNIYILKLGGWVPIPPDDSRIQCENETEERTAMRYGKGRSEGAIKAMEQVMKDYDPSLPAMTVEKISEGLVGAPAAEAEEAAPEATTDEPGSHA